MAPAPAMDFKQALDMFRALDGDTMTKQLDTVIKVVLQLSKQFKSTHDGGHEVHDLSKAVLAALMRTQQAFASSSSRPRKVARR